MKVAVHWGCVILTAQYGYEMSLRCVMPKLDVELVDLVNVSCCGTPIQSMDRFAALYLAARNLAIAEGAGLDDLLLPCNGCYLSLLEAAHTLNRNERLKKQICSLLSDEGLKYSGSIRIWHTINLLHDVVGEKRVKGAVKSVLSGLKLAVHYGCHILRPSALQPVDDPEKPTKMDNLVKWLGADSVPYYGMLDCCGAMLMLSHHDAALTLSGLKVKAVQERGADALIVSCPSCQMMFDVHQRGAAAAIGTRLSLPVLYYTQLLGIAMGIDVEKLGLQLNRSPVEEFLRKANLR